MRSCAFGAASSRHPERLLTHVCPSGGRSLRDGKRAAPFPQADTAASRPTLAPGPWGAECRSLLTAEALLPSGLSPLGTGAHLYGCGSTGGDRGAPGSRRLLLCLFAARSRRVQAAPAGRRKRDRRKRRLLPRPALHSLPQRSRRDCCRYRLCLAAGTVLLETARMTER